MFAIQLARRAGYKVIATASPSSFDLVKSYGAHQVVSYRDQDAALIEIKKLTNGGVSAGLDCVGGQKNITFAVNAFGPKGGKLSTTLIGSKSKRKDVELSPLMVFTVFGKVRPLSQVELIIDIHIHPHYRKVSRNARKTEMV
jgi:NADPH:quinone reductase-like Zn-dependent oxidoreductase